jgi:NADH-quinone oxidoreductase subunit E
MTVEKILLNYDPEINNLLLALKEVSASFGYVSQTDAQKVAEYFAVPLSQVFQVASFYDSIAIEKKPPLVIRVCSGTHCAVAGAADVTNEIENLFGIKSGDKFNPKVRLEIISCLGQCGEGPIVVVNEKTYQRVTRGEVHKILEEYI